MSDSLTGHVEAAEVLETRQEKYEEVGDLSGVLPDQFRVVEVSNGEGYHVERQTTHGERWIPVARFSEPDAKYEWADEIHDAMGDSYRCVVDHTDGEVWLEARFGDD